MQLVHNLGFLRAIVPIADDNGLHFNCTEVSYLRHPARYHTSHNEVTRSAHGNRSAAHMYLGNLIMGLDRHIRQLISMWRACHYWYTLLNIKWKS